jgi:hypothetical protein
MIDPAFLIGVLGIEIAAIEMAAISIAATQTKSAVAD